MKRTVKSAQLCALGIPFVALAVVGAGVGGSILLSGCQEEPRQEIELAVTQVEASGLSAEVCIQDNWQAHGNKQNLTCSANDVRVARATNICVHDGMSGCLAESTCTEGLNVTFTADFEVELTAQDRYDIGVYFATDGGGDDGGALTGQCVLNTIDNVNNTTNFINNDAAPDVCGDIDAVHNPQIMQLTITTLCVSNGDEENPQLLLPNCTSWRQPGSNEVCDEAEDAYPGSPSKCNCDDEFAIAITVEDPAATVTKTAVEACVTYSVSVENTTATRDMVLDSLSDAPFGDITDPTNANLCHTTCGQPASDGGDGGAGVLPVTLEPGDSYSCEFGAILQSSSDPQTDIVTASFDSGEHEETGTETVIVDLDVAEPSESDAGPDAGL